METIVRVIEEFGSGYRVRVEQGTGSENAVELLVDKHGRGEGTSIVPRQRILVAIEKFSRDAFTLKTPRGGTIEIGERTLVMGVLNVTPDSFSDGGEFIEKDTALDHALSMVEEGADIIDIGGESTRPGAEPVPLEVELERVVPVIKALRKASDVTISIDTCKSRVAEEALDAGADIINDITAFRLDPRMKEVASQRECPTVLMHIKGTPRDMQKNPVYDDVISEIYRYLSESIKLAVDAGLPEEQIIVDPGIGFGKTLGHNIEIIRNLRQFRSLGRPILIGVSRKSFIGAILGGKEPKERVWGTASAVAVSILNGASIVRVHDVAEMRDVVAVADALSTK